jgi:predicted nuclease with TOPRIM domain
MATIETDLKEILGEFKQEFANINRRLDKIDGDLNDLKVTVGQIDQKVSGLDKRMDILENRVNGLTGWLFGILFALVGGLLGLLGKIAFFPNP